LAIGTARAGVDIEIGVIGICLAAQNPAQLHLLDGGAYGADVFFHLVERRAVVFAKRDLEQFLGIGEPLPGLLKLHDHLVGVGSLSLRRRGLLEVVPKTRLAYLVVERLPFLLQIVDVKDNL
jgi:hypothetical protein